MRGLVVVAVCSVGCFSKPDAPSGSIRDARDDAPADVAVDAQKIVGGLRRVITVTQPPTAPLVRFPLAVILDDDVLLQAAGLEGSQIAFATMNDEVLECEIVHYDSAAGSLEAWVLIPELPATQYQFKLVYGTDVSPPCVKTRVWGEYPGAWHFADASTMVGADSSPHGLHVTTHAGTPSTDSGVIGAGRVFSEDDGSPDMMCAAPNPVLDLGLAPFTYEVWVHPKAEVAGFNVVLFKGGQSAPSAGFDFELTSTGTWNAWIRDSDAGEDTAAFTDRGSDFQNTWSQLVAVVDRSTNRLQLYLNGEYAAADDELMTQSVTGPAPLCFGDAAPANAMRGILDEPRIHSMARTGPWIKTSYENLTTVGFLSIASAPL